MGSGGGGDSAGCFCRRHRARRRCGVVDDLPVVPKGFAEVTVHPDPNGIAHGSGSDMLVIEIRGATIRASNGTSAGLLAAALRELKA